MPERAAHELRVPRPAYLETLAREDELPGLVCKDHESGCECQRFRGGPWHDPEHRQDYPQERSATHSAPSRAAARISRAAPMDARGRPTRSVEQHPDPFSARGMAEV